MAQSQFSEVLSFVSSWANKTDAHLEARIKELNIGITDALYKSVRSNVYKKAGEIIQYDLSFMLYGRFRDMGAGREVNIETIEKNRKKILKGKNRKPAPWYNKPFYGNLNALQGAIGFQVMEQSIGAIIVELRKDGDKRWR